MDLIKDWQYFVQQRRFLFFWSICGDLNTIYRSIRFSISKREYFSSIEDANVFAAKWRRAYAHNPGIIFTEVRKEDLL